MSDYLPSKSYLEKISKEEWARRSRLANLEIRILGCAWALIGLLMVGFIGSLSPFHFHFFQTSSSSSSSSSKKVSYTTLINGKIPRFEECTRDTFMQMAAGMIPQLQPAQVVTRCCRIVGGKGVPSKMECHKKVRK